MPYAGTIEERRRRNREATRRYRARHPGRRRDQQLRELYGLSLREFEDLFVWQGGRCAICARPAIAHDHDHATGRPRGLLCRSCNTGLGALGDTVEALQRALAYLMVIP